MEKKREMSGRTITRRDFLKGTAYRTVGLALGLRSLEAAAAEAKEGKPFAATPAGVVSRVVLVRDKDAVDARHRAKTEVAARMIDTAVNTFAGEEDAVKAWRRFFRPDDTVGVKISRCGWMRVHTCSEVIDAVASRLRSIGIPEERIIVKDYHLPLERCTALINLPSIKVHTLTGIAVSVKNYVNFSKKIPRYHAGKSHEEKLAETWFFPQVKGKTRLIIVDALRPYFGPGPQVNPLHYWDYKGILVAKDPVAVDTVCLRICQKKRNLYKGEEWPITPPPKAIAAADEKYHLGTSDPLKIKLVRVGWMKDAFI